MRPPHLVLLGLVGLGSPVWAQQLPPSLAPLEFELGQNRAGSVQAASALRSPPPPAVVPVLAGITGGVVGFFALGAVGYELSGGGEICGDDPCGWVGGIYGALIGEVVGVGLGAHLGNARRGRLDTTIGASLAGLMVGGALVGRAGWGVGVSIPLVGIAQLAAAVFAERLSAHAR